MNKKILLIALLLITTIPLSITARADESVSWLGKLFSSDLRFQTDTLTIQTQDDRTFELNVELAKTQAQHAQGLMNRESMKKNAGMLFLFGSEQDVGFWMKNTLIPLDMIFISKDGTIHHIHSNARPLDEETRVKAEKPSYAVLEINGGQADRWNIKAGDKVLHASFRNMLAE